MSKKSRRPKQEAWLNALAYAFQARRTTPDMTAEEVAAATKDPKRYDPDGSRGLEIINAVLDAIQEMEQDLYQDPHGLIPWQVAFDEIKRRMTARMRAA